jgi:hypothetical protein
MLLKVTYYYFDAEFIFLVRKQCCLSCFCSLSPVVLISQTVSNAWLID